jgi:2,3-bisphosphoglycerate-independent phosphoglycerate mutase
VDVAIQDGSFNTNPAFIEAIAKVKQTGKALHLLGLLSPGGVHSHENHLYAMLALAKQSGLTKVYVHAFLDGRDTPPRSATASLQRLQQTCDTLGVGRIASIVGRYYAMDRDNRWDRVEAAYNLLTLGKAKFAAADALTALEYAYQRGENDEFVQATPILSRNGEAVQMEDGDAIIFMNFRADRARQLTHAFTDEEFSGFQREYLPKLSAFVTLSSYGEDVHATAAFAPETIRNGIGEYLSNLGLKQLRIAETEKYAHVTYFMSGGIEQPFPGEDRILVPSPKVATYDLQPEMSAFEVTDQLVAAIHSGQYAAILCNYANGDMVGHSGDMDAAVKAVEALDVCIGRVVEAMQAAGGEVLITADHGNVEQMLDRSTHQAHTAHTLNTVPFLYIGRPATLAADGALKDIAPSLLTMMGLPQPAEMTGHSLIHLQ